MEHAYFRDRVSAYFDHSLTPQEQVIVEEHIAGCAECQKLLADIEKLERLVQKQGELGGTEDYWEKAAKKIEKRLGVEAETEIVNISRSRWYSGLTWKIAAAAASVVLLVYIGYRKGDFLKERELTAPPASPTEKAVIPQESIQKAEPSAGASDQLREERPRTETYRREAVQQQAVRRDESAAKSQVSQKPIQPAPQKAAPPPAPEQNMVTKEMAPQTAAEAKDAETSIKATPPPSALQSESVAATGTELAATAKREAVKRAETSLDSVNAAAELEHWRSVRDSLLAEVQPKESSITKKLKLPTATVQGLTSGKPSLSARDRQELQLLEACYNVARLTKDTSEYNVARDTIQKVAADSSSANRQAAASYLEKLGKR